MTYLRAAYTARRAGGDSQATSAHIGLRRVHRSDDLGWWHRHLSDRLSRRPGLGEPDTGGEWIGEPVSDVRQRATWQVGTVPVVTSNRRPAFERPAFNCPICDAYAEMTWRHPIYPGGGLTCLHTATCGVCKSNSVWLEQPELFGITGDPDDKRAMIWPSGWDGVPAADDMPEAVEGIYDEARAVVQASPRAAAALLRLALERLLNGLYPDASNLNDAIRLAAENGLPRRVVDSMDVLRFNGNAAIHELVREDTPETASSLFKVLNIVVRQLITEPREIDELHSALPDGVRDQITRRDSRP